MGQALTQLDRCEREGLYYQIVGALDRLPGELREVFELSHYEGRSIEEISKTLDRTPEQVTRLLQAANRMFYGFLKGKTLCLL